MSNGQSNVSQSVDRLSRVLGFDPARKGGTGVFADALEVVNKKRAEAAKDKAVGLIEQAITLREQMAQAENTFNAQKKKFEKELGKLVGRIEALAGGKSPSQIEADERDAAENAKEENCTASSE